MTQPTIKFVLLVAIAACRLVLLARWPGVSCHRVIWRGVRHADTDRRRAQHPVFRRSNLDGARVGVGRGADLLLYVLVVTFGLVSVILFRRLDALERKYVVIARAVAIREASGSWMPRPEQPASPASGRGLE